MPWNGSGNYAPPASPVWPAVPGTVIEAGKFNTLILDISGALSNCLTRDGQTRWSASQNAGGYRLTALGDGVNPTDAVTKQQLDEKIGAGGGTATGNIAVAPATGEASFTATYSDSTSIKLYSNNLDYGVFGGTGGLVSVMKATGKKYLFGADFDTLVRTGTGTAWAVDISGRAATAGAADSATSATSAANADKLGGKLPSEFWQDSEGVAAFTPIGGDKLPDGLVFRWGTLAAGDGVQTVTFSSPFPNACFGLFPSILTGGSGAPSNYKVYVGVPTVANCTVDISGIGAPGGYYLAVGW